MTLKNSPVRGVHIHFWKKSTISRDSDNNENVIALSILILIFFSLLIAVVSVINNNKFYSMIQLCQVRIYPFNVKSVYINEKIQNKIEFERLVIIITIIIIGDKKETFMLLCYNYVHKKYFNSCELCYKCDFVFNYLNCSSCD